MHKVQIPSAGKILTVADKRNLLEVLRQAGLAPDAPCGGNGTCGKCKVRVNGRELLACQTEIEGDMVLDLPEKTQVNILAGGIDVALKMNPVREGYLLAFDIGTTTVVGYLLDQKDGTELAVSSILNPQAPYGADVISRIQYALNGDMDTLTNLIRSAMVSMTEELCHHANISPTEIGVVSVVGNPAMQQLFLGISPRNLVEIPFAPVITEAQVVEAAPYLACCERACLLIVPDISGYVGADTVACVLSTQLADQEENVLLVDIGTNGEMVMGSRERMVACSAAAGPALEGAKIQFGMRGASGAIDHVWLENGELQCSVIGGGEAKGICGSGIIDAVAAAMESGLLNKRGRIQLKEEINGQRVIPLTNSVYLTQDDIREVQMAKGAIAAGIELMATHLGISIESIGAVYLAGAFGSFLKPASACKIGLLPEVLLNKICAVGNAAGTGAKMIACSESKMRHTQELVSKIEFIELASASNFQRCFAKNMSF